MSGPHQSDYAALLQPLLLGRTWLFDVTGRPTPQGSKSAHAVMNRNTGKPVFKNGRPLVAMKESSSDGLTQWREDVRVISRAHAPETPVNGPVAIGVQFRFRRPANHYGPIQTPDLHEHCECGDGRVPGARPGTTKKCTVCRGDGVKVTKRQSVAGLRSDDHYVTSGGVGDLEKLLRSTFDALASAQWFLNDKQIARLLPVEKIWVDRFTGQEGATILIAELAPPNTTIPGGTTNG